MRSFNRPLALGRLLEHSLDAALIMDEHCVIRFANPAMETLSGWKIVELNGKSFNNLLPQAIADRHDDYVRRYCLNPDSSTVLGRAREMILRHRDGELISVELKAVDLGMEGGMRFFGSFIADLRPRKALEAQNEALLATLQRQALTDALTGIPNRRAFDIEAVSTMSYAEREGWPATIAIIDIDLFKSVNDRFGHTAGDAVLKTVSGAALAAVRRGDFFARVGGEEFGLLLPRTAITSATSVVERIRLAVASAETVATDGSAIQVTVSAGLCAFESVQSFEALWHRADAALYQAKADGRDRLVIY